MDSVSENKLTAQPLRRQAYKLKEAADILGVSTKSLRRAIARKLLKTNRTFRCHLVSATELERFANQ